MIIRMKPNVFYIANSIKLFIMINAKKIVEKLRGEADRAAKTLYLSKSLYKDFEGLCDKDGVKPSGVIEELMKVYIESHKESKPKPIKSKTKKPKST